MMYAGILAGGSGSRLGSEVPKQFLILGDKPILVRSVKNFFDAECFDGVIVAVKADWIDYARDLLDRFLPDSMLRRVHIIEGGYDRTDSMLHVIDEAKRLALLSGESDTDSILLATHDAARPFTTVEVIRENVRMAERDGCAGTAVPATDTILISANGSLIDDIPDRGMMFQAQTPQSFRIGRFLSALDKLTPQQRAEVTDMCGVFTRAGMPVGFSRGDVRNIKITTPMDMAVGECIAREFD